MKVGVEPTTIERGEFIYGLCETLDWNYPFNFKCAITKFGFNVPPQ